MNTRKIAHLVIGCNGSGKTTYYELILKDMLGENINYINTDKISAEYQRNNMPKGEANRKATRDALKQIMQSIKNKQSLAFETLFADTTPMGSIAIAKELKENGYTLEGYLIHTNNVEINIQNVERRTITNTGHYVPREIINQRYNKINENYKNHMLNIFDKLTIIDNSNNNFSHKIIIFPLIDKNIPENLTAILNANFMTFEKFEKECVLREKEELYLKFINSLEEKSPIKNEALESGNDLQDVIIKVFK